MMPEALAPLEQRGMSQADAPGAPGWRAKLDLAFEVRAPGTVLIRNRHEGPLLVQKPLYPEGRGTCHVALLHPPGGVAGGDRLRIDVALHERSRVLMTTPGATKWYRSAGPVAQQNIRIVVAEGAMLEWLPRESILFNGSNTSTSLDVTLAPNAGYVGWEITGFGRRASGERWASGRLKMTSGIQRAGRLLWSETADVDASGGFTTSSVGLAGFTVSGTLVVAGYDIGTELLGACRAVRPAAAGTRRGITRVPSVLIARYLGDSTEQVFEWFTGLWTVLRPVLTERAACAPRVWAC
jgi:urease accessory protein